MNINEYMIELCSDFDACERFQGAITLFRVDLF